MVNKLTVDNLLSQVTHQPRFKFLEIKEKELKRSGVYFLSKEKSIIYIGKSTDVFNRPFSHKPHRNFDKVKILEATEQWIDYLESAFVGKYRPTDNGRQWKEKVTSHDFSVSDELAFTHCNHALKIYSEFESTNFIGKNSNILTIDDAHKEIRQLTLEFSDHKTKARGSIEGRKILAKRIIGYYKLDKLFSKSDTKEINRITGWNFAGYKRVLNHTYPSDSRCIAHTNDGITWTVWSWNKAITGLSHSVNLTQAMRLAVTNQIQAYRATSKQVCNFCGHDKNLSVDHKSKPFCFIRDEFIQSNPHITNSIESRGNGWRICFPELNHAWQKFHDASADYQMLCSSCNSIKGAGENACRLNPQEVACP